MITHDRYFLDSVCNRIVEVDKGQTYSYDTNYSGFLELKAAREESERASERKRQSILRKEIEWMRYEQELVPQSRRHTYKDMRLCETKRTADRRKS